MSSWPSGEPAMARPLHIPRGSRPSLRTPSRTTSSSPSRSGPCARVDLTRAGFSARKLRAIRELGMGTNAKLILELEPNVEARPPGP
jgi:hypothetical protein